MQPRATIDFETRSECDLRTHGSWRYSLDPTTDILCLAFRIPTWPAGEVGLWHPALPHLNIPQADEFDNLADLLLWVESGGLIEAHNAFFERGMWQNILVPRYAFPPVRHEQWRCSAAKAAALALPRSLDGAISALHLAVQKDSAGHTLMRKVSKPRKALKGESDQWANDHGAGRCTVCKGKGTYKRKPCAACDGGGMLSGDADTVPELPTLWHESEQTLAELWDYCCTDVLAEEGLSAAIPDLTPMETRLYLLDQQINARGFQLDPEAVTGALDLIAQETRDLNAQLSTLTNGQVTRATQRERMKTWFATQGLVLADTQGTTIDAALETAEGVVRDGLTIVRELGRSSTAKYQAMQRWACPDGRVRGGLLYHGASTGRFSGVGIQPHNFVRGTVKDQMDLWDVLKTGDRAAIRAFYGSVMLALANGLRGAICAAPGCELFVADYAQIEARVLLWLAEDEEHLNLFRTDADIYCDMAASIYQKPINKQDHPNERQLGKVAVLGCLAADTRVLTSAGWKAILDVTLTDQLWDGTCWVSHGGVIAQGVQQTICLQGLSLTPDHLILVGNRWIPSDQALIEPVLSRALATASVNLPCKATSGVRAVRLLGSLFSAPAETPFTESANRIFVEGHPRDVSGVQLSNPGIGGRNTTATRIFSLMINTVHDYWIALAPSLIDVRTPAITDSPITGAEVFWSTPHGVPIAAPSWRISSPWLDGTSRSWNWIARIIHAAMNRVISGLSREKLTSVIDAPSVSCNNELRSWKCVYDIANAGPRQRFTVWTNQGPVIVHNCGYQMGAKKFLDAAANYGVTIDADMAARTVAAYRQKFWRVVDMWEDQERAAISAISTRQRTPCGRVIWLCDDRFLFCQLPSGRRLSYPFPEVQQRRTSWGEWKLSVTFMGVDPYTRQWTRQHTYGGMLVENIVQAVARDLMAEAMLACEASGVYRPVLTVHDEIVAEAEEGVGNTADFESLLTRISAWAIGCPVAAESWKGTRYKK